MESSHMLPAVDILYMEMKNISNRAREIILAYQGILVEGREGAWLQDSQRVHRWQSFAQGWPTQRHCAPVIAALQRQMKLSAGRWLYSDSRSALSLQSAANKYVGFQSCQGRRWTVGQGAKRRAKAFPSPRNLFSMSLVTSPGQPFSVSHPKGPGAPDLTHCLPGELCEPLSLPLTAITLSLSLCISVFATSESQKYPQQRGTASTPAVQTIYDRMWFNLMRMKWLLLTNSENKYLFINFYLDEVEISLSEQHAGKGEAQVCIWLLERSWQTICRIAGLFSPSCVTHKTMTLFSKLHLANYSIL